MQNTLCADISNPYRHFLAGSACEAAFKSLVQALLREFAVCKKWLSCRNIGSRWGSEHTIEVYPSFAENKLFGVFT